MESGVPQSESEHVEPAEELEVRGTTEGGISLHNSKTTPAASEHSRARRAILEICALEEERAIWAAAGDDREISETELVYAGSWDSYPYDY